MDQKGNLGNEAENLQLLAPNFLLKIPNFMFYAVHCPINN